MCCGQYFLKSVELSQPGTTKIVQVSSVLSGCGDNITDHMNWLIFELTPFLGRDPDMVWSDSALYLRGFENQYLRGFENQQGKGPAQVTWLPSFQSLEHTMLPPSALCTCHSLPFRPSPSIPLVPSLHSGNSCASFSSQLKPPFFQEAFHNLLTSSMRMSYCSIPSRGNI